MIGCLVVLEIQSRKRLNAPFPNLLKYNAYLSFAALTVAENIAVALTVVTLALSTAADVFRATFTRGTLTRLARAVLLVLAGAGTLTGATAATLALTFQFALAVALLASAGVASTSRILTSLLTSLFTVTLLAAALLRLLSAAK